MRALPKCRRRLKYDSPISEARIRESAYKRIARCIDPASPLVQRKFYKTDDPFENMVVALAGIQRSFGALIDA